MSSKKQKQYISQPALDLKFIKFRKLWCGTYPEDKTSSPSQKCLPLKKISNKRKIFTKLELSYLYLLIFDSLKILCPNCNHIICHLIFWILCVQINSFQKQSIKIQSSCDGNSKLGQPILQKMKFQGMKYSPRCFFTHSVLIMF